MKRIAICFCFTCLLILSCSNENHNQDIKEMGMVRGYKNWYIDDFRCGLYVPPSYDSTRHYPLIIFLHGYSDTTTWNLPWYNEPFVTKDPCIVLTPKCPKNQKGGWGDSYNPGTSPMMAKAWEMVSMAEDAFSLDTNRYYIYGSSMGGYGTYGAIKKYPEKFAAAYVECGNPNIDMVPVIKNIPLWMFHGSEDPIVPIQPSRDLYKAVIAAGGTSIRFTEYPGVGHNVWDYTGKETTLRYWLLAQRKGSVHLAPEAIQEFTASVSPDDKVSLSWDLPSADLPVTDNSVWYCRIYRNSSPVAEIYNDNTQYVDSTAIDPGDYVYKITAVNYYFRESEPSQEVTVTLEK